MQFVMLDFTESKLFQLRFVGQISDKIHGWLDFFDETQLFILENNDLTFGYPKPLFPNVVSVEGTSVKPANPLTSGKEISMLKIKSLPLKIASQSLWLYVLYF